MNLRGFGEISEGIYWVGSSGQDGGLHCNPYLLVDGDEAVLIDPGSVLDFEYVYENVCRIIPLEKISYVILHHQDPDFCASVPLFEQKGACFSIVTHWRTQSLVKYYGINSPYYIINEHNSRLVLKSGRELFFVATPYLHFPGAIATYDQQSKTLFSSDLFGAFSYEWSLYAGDDYMERMKAFHEHYMPSNDILRPVMEMLLTMDIARIAPQHGSVIKDNVRDYIRALRDLECGAFITPIKRDLAKSGGFRLLFNNILQRYAAVFGRAEVLKLLEGLDISFDQDSLEITDYNYRGSVLWDLLFEKILVQKGQTWIYVIEPLVKKLCREYDVELPSVFQTAFLQAEKEISDLYRENASLKEINSKLNSSFQEAQLKLTRDAATDLYNYDFFRSYLEAELKDLLTENAQQNPALIIMDLDNADRIRVVYGDDEIDEILRSMVYLIRNMKDDNTVLFRLHTSALAVYIPHTGKSAAVTLAESLRYAVSSSEKFIEDTTVSVGVLCLEELREQGIYTDDPAQAMYSNALQRVRMAKMMGANTVCSQSSLRYYQDFNKILLVDADEVNIDVLKTFLENMKITVLTAADGADALAIAEKESPDLIISEIMIPQMDGFLVREKLLMRSHTKNIPFIIVSHLKNDNTVQRAAALQIVHYFQKPFMLSELLGVINNIIKGRPNDEY